VLCRGSSVPKSRVLGSPCLIKLNFRPWPKFLEKKNTKKNLKEQGDKESTKKKAGKCKIQRERKGIGKISLEIKKPMEGGEEKNRKSPCVSMICTVITYKKNFLCDGEPRQDEARWVVNDVWWSLLRDH